MSRPTAEQSARLTDTVKLPMSSSPAMRVVEDATANSQCVSKTVPLNLATVSCQVTATVYKQLFDQGT